jgi:hypothetical protein
MISDGCEGFEKLRRLAHQRLPCPISEIILHERIQIRNDFLFRKSLNSIRNLFHKFLPVEGSNTGGDPD